MREINTENREITLAELTYLLYFTVMFGARAIGLFEGMFIYNVSLVIGMLLFIAKVAVTEHTPAEYCVIGVLLLISMIVYYNTGEKGLLLYFTMMLGMKGVSVKRVFKLAVTILSLSFTTLVILSVTGLKEEIVYLKDRAGFGSVIRHSLGYPYPNTLFTTYIVLMVLIMYALGKQSRRNLVLSTLFLLLGAVYIFLYSCSNTGLIVSVFYLAVNLYLQQRKGLLFPEKAAIQLVYPICLLFSIVGPLITRGKLFNLFDRVLHNRWAYSLYYLTNEPITLLGVRFGEAPNTNYMIDSSFLYSFLQLGVIPFIILTFLYISMIHDYTKRESKAELAIIVSFCFLGLSDPFLFNLSYKNLMFLFVGEYVYRKLQEIEQRNYRLLSVGGRVFSYDNTVYKRCSHWLDGIRKLVSKRSTAISLIYLSSVGLIGFVIYTATFSSHVAGKIDKALEWEYVRNVLSLSLGAGIFIIIGYLFVLWKRENK